MRATEATTRLTASPHFKMLPPRTPPFLAIRYFDRGAEPFPVNETELIEPSIAPHSRDSSTESVTSSRLEIAARNAMNEFLQPTAIIDSDHPTIVAAAADIAGDATSDEEIARRCFLWVRDSVRHSSDHAIPVVTCTASDVLKHRAGFCYAKSHLLAALLRARGIPAALCYQRLAFDSSASSFFLHGLVAIHLQQYGWYRVDPRGNKPGVSSDFSPPVERLPYSPTVEGERDVPGRFPDALACVVSTLQQWPTADDVRAHLPDYAPES